jgi:hypothetical protein
MSSSAAGTGRATPPASRSNTSLLETLVINQAAQLEQLKQILADRPAPRKPAALPTPEAFDGSSPVDYEQWKRKVEAKLNTDRSIHGYDGLSRVTYAMSLLKGAASQAANDWLDRLDRSPSAPPLFLTALFEYLDARYKDHFRGDRAVETLDALRQGARPFSEFLPGFEEAWIDAGRGGWPEQIRVEALRERLANDLHTQSISALAGTGYKGDYAKYTEILKEIDLEMRRKRKTTFAGGFPRSSARPAAPAFAPPAPVTIDRDGDTRMTGVNATQLQPQAPRQRLAVAPITQAERDARLQAKACLNCGHSGHRARACAYDRPAILGARINAAAQTPSAPPAPVMLAREASAATEQSEN